MTEIDRAIVIILGVVLFSIFALDSRFALSDAIKDRKPWAVVRILLPLFFFGGIFIFCIYRAGI